MSTATRLYGVEWAPGRLMDAETVEMQGRLERPTYYGSQDLRVMEGKG